MLERIRVWAWPRRSWERSLRYVVHRLLRLRADPHTLALGCAIGVFAAVTPLIGLQMLLAGALALLLRASLAAAMLGTFFGNPVTWPVIWSGTYALGCALLGIPGAFSQIDFGAEFARFSQTMWQLSPEVFDAALSMVWPFVEPMLVGSIPIGLICAFVFYRLTKRAAVAHQMRRRQGAGYDFTNPLGALIASYQHGVEAGT